MKIIAYKKYIDSSITRTLELPMDKQNNFIGTELATLKDGLTYVSMPAASVLPKQPKEISKSVKVVTLTAAQKAEIKMVSPHVKLINSRVCEKIRAVYTSDDELKFARLSITALGSKTPLSAKDAKAVADYQVFVENERANGAAEKTALGL